MPSQTIGGVKLFQISVSQACLPHLKRVAGGRLAAVIYSSKSCRDVLKDGRLPDALEAACGLSMVAHYLRNQAQEAPDRMGLEVWKRRLPLLF